LAAKNGHTEIALALIEKTTSKTVLLSACKIAENLLQEQSSLFLWFPEESPQEKIVIELRKKIDQCSDDFSIPTTLLSTAKKRCLNDDDHHTTEESSTQVTRTNHSLSSSYDNPILNNPKLLKVALEFEGVPLVNRLINIGMNPKYCVAILAAYEDNGFEAMKSELIKLEAVEELAQQKAKDNLVHYIPIFDRLRDKDYTDESLDRETETFVNIFDKITTSFLELFGGLEIDLDVQTSYLMVWGEMLAASAPQFFGSPRRGNTDPDPDFGGYGGGEQATNMPEFGVSMFIAGNDNVNITLASE